MCGVNKLFGTVDIAMLVARLLCWFIRANFFSLVQPFSCFSLAIACYVKVGFNINALVYFVLLRENLYLMRFVLARTPNNVVCHTNVKQIVMPVC